MPEDTVTTTVEGAAGHAARFAAPYYDEMAPTPDEALADQMIPAVCEEPGCEDGDITGDDGTVGTCGVCGGSGEAFR